MTGSLQSRPVLGVLLVVLSMSLIGLIDNFIKLIAAEAGLWEFHFLRSLVVCGMLLVIARVMHWRLRPRNWRAVILRSFFFSTAMVLYFGAAGMIPVSQAAAGLFTSPVFVLLISAMFLGVRIGVWRILAVVVGFSGVLMILRPMGQGVSVLMFIPVAAGLFYALNGIATRRWCGQEGTATLLFGLFAGLGVWGALGLLVFTLFPVPADVATALPFFTRGWVAPSGAFTVWLLVQAFGSIISVALLTRGYQLAEVSYAAVAEYSFLIAAAFWSWVLWGSIPDGLAILGAGAIALSGIIIVMRSR